MADSYLFSPSLLDKFPTHPKAFSASEMVIRPLHSTDGKPEKEFGKLLSQLTDIGDLGPESFKNQFKKLASSKASHVVVLEYFPNGNKTQGKLVGAATLLLEEKFIHGCGKCGHVEDVVVSSSMRGKSLGLFLIEALVHMGEKLGCYKIILDCSDKNVPFYEKCGFTKKEVQMVKYYEKQKSKL